MFSRHSNSTSRHRNILHPSSDATQSTFIANAPMAIPHAREHVPPPLPPPQLIPELNDGEDPGWQLQNDPSASDFAKPISIKPGSSLLGGFHRPSSLEREANGVSSKQSPPFAGRRSFLPSISPTLASRDVEMTNGSVTEDAISSARVSADYRLRSEQRLEQDTLGNSSQAYDKQILNKIGGPSAPRQIISASSPSHEIASASSDARRNSQARLFAIAEPAFSKWTPSTSASSWENQYQRKNSVQTDELSRYNSYEQSIMSQDDITLDDAQSSERSQDRSPTTSEELNSLKWGSKRRASSPPRERDERTIYSSRSDMLRKRSPEHSTIKQSRLLPGHASVSSASSFGGSKQDSLPSSLSMASNPSSATSYASASSMGTTAGQVRQTSPQYRQAEVDGLKLGSPVSNTQKQNQRSLGSGPPYVCECCPKKPKRLPTEQALRAHESEKQYGCQYCTNRFKNKNEAERHQNSLHLRRHSWSCAALQSFTSAFHTSSTDGAIDVCGYCGEEFPNPADWELRKTHLSQSHKFRLCNPSKKFFRADHFRQHLKHSHDGTSGKWTNMLEHACMRMESPILNKQGSLQEMNTKS